MNFSNDSKFYKSKDILSMGVLILDLVEKGFSIRQIALQYQNEGDAGFDDFPTCHVWNKWFLAIPGLLC